MTNLRAIFKNFPEGRSSMRPMCIETFAFGVINFEIYVGVGILVA